MPTTNSTDARTWIKFDWNTGEILDVFESRIVYTKREYAPWGDSYIPSAFPDNFTALTYKMKAVLVDQDAPSDANYAYSFYLIERSTGYAYNRYGTHDSQYDEEPETVETPDPEPTVTPSIGDDTGDDTGGETGGETGDDTEQDSDAMAGAVTEGSIINIVFNGGEAWQLDTDTNLYTRSISSDSIDRSTVLFALGVNRGALRDHLYWEARDGEMLFSTQQRPTERLTIHALLRTIGTTRQAKGVIECWPGAGLMSKRFRQSLNAPSGWSVSLAACGTSGDSVTIRTNVGFAAANLLFATPEWTGNTRVIMPRVFVDDAHKHLCYTLTNCGPSEVTVTEVSIRLMYNGSVSNLTEEVQDSASLDGYITEYDIDLLDEEE